MLASVAAASLGPFGSLQCVAAWTRRYAVVSEDCD